MKKKLLAMVMTLAMVLSLVPVTALAEEMAAPEEQPTTNTVEVEEVEQLEDVEETVEEQSVETPSKPAATDIIQDGVKYTISSGDAIVIGCESDAEKLIIPATITVEDKEYPVTKVNSGLQNNSTLTSVEIQAPITKLENSLFLNDVNLVSVKLPDTLMTIETSAFQNCSSLKQIYLPEGLEIIKNSVFTGTAIESITLPSTLKELQSSAFNGLTTLKQVDFNNAETSVGEKCFQGCNALKTVSNTENITELGDYAFGSDYQNYNNVNVHCQSLTGEIKLNSVTKIGKAAFKNCTALNKVSGLENVTEIPDEAFNHCSVLNSVDGLENVTKIGNNAFSECTSAKRVDGKTVTTNIEELKGLELANLTSIGSKALGSVKVTFEIDESTFNALTFLGEGAFSGVSNLTGKLVLPEGITSIGKNTFRATGITEVILPDSVRSIGEAAFYNCQNLVNVQVGRKDGKSSQLTKIEKGAFANDTSIASFVIEADKADVSISMDKFKPGLDEIEGFPEQVKQYIQYTVASVEGEDIGTGTDLQTAIDNASQGDPVTITATKSFVVKSTVTIPDGKTITLTGDNITVQSDRNFSGPLFVVEDDANLSLDGTLTYKCQNLSDGVFAQVKGEMTMNNGTISRLSSSLSGTGVIDVNGGLFTMEGGTISEITGSGSGYGAVYVQNGGIFRMNGGKIADCTAKNQYSGAVVLAEGTMTMEGGEIDGNTATEFNSAGGVLVDNASTFTMTGGTISNNAAKRGGGVVVRDEAGFIMSNGTISGNTSRLDSNTITLPNAGGGGVFVEADALFTMNGGTITANTTNGMGGGVATAVLNESDTEGGGRFSMTGGTISKNKASCGGGVYSWSGEGRVVLEGGNIVDNTATRQGGGVYVSHAPWAITIQDALVTNNTATIQGGGIWACPTGTIDLGTSIAVFGNSAGKSADDAAFLRKWNSEYSTSFSSQQYGGGMVTWYRDTAIMNGDPSYGAFGGSRFDAADPGNPVGAVSGETILGYGLKAVVSEESKALAETAPLKITGNKAERGGGIGTNGKVTVPGELPGTTSVTVHKVWAGNSGNYPSTVTVHLIRTKDGKSQTIATVILSEKSKDKEDGKAWSYTFSNLDDSYTYTVTEDAVPGYRTSITQDKKAEVKTDDGEIVLDNELSYTITNTYRRGGGGGGGSSTVDIPDEDVPTGLDLKNHYGYIIGYPVDYYTGEPTTDQTKKPVRPEGKITRAEVATIYFRMLTEENRAANWNQVSGFSDVKSKSWYNNAISTLTKAGILEGYEDGTFRPNGYITRAEFATIAIRFFSGVYEGEDLFPDIKDHWARDYINNAADKGLVKGYEDGTFGPDRYITRAEAVTLVNRTLNRHPDKDCLHEDMLVWPDNMDTSKWYYADMQEATNSHEPDKDKSDSEKEYWSKTLPIRDWEALEKEWSNANSAPGEGEVV